MSATACTIVRASILARDPEASLAAVRCAVFLRLYGHEFEAAERERILARLDGARMRSLGSLERSR